MSPEYAPASEDYMYQVAVDDSRNDLLSHFSHTTINERYLADTDRTAQDAFARVASAYADDAAHAQRIYEYASKLWFGFSSPVLSNGGTQKGLPISCYLNMPEDSREGILAHYTENGWLASLGGGIGSYFGALRSDGMSTSKGSASGGQMPFIKVVDSEMLAFNQGKTRRGTAAIYTDISHPEVEQFIVMRKASGGDLNRKSLNLHHGINITDAFMEAVRNDETWDLIDPHHKVVTKTVKARGLWTKILNTRMQTGEPYLNFIDTVNAALPEALKKRGLKVQQSNLCTEITLPTMPDYTAVCCLSSVNAEKFYEWKDDPRFLNDLARFLDNVMESFIQTAPEPLWRAVRSAKAERSIGLGCMGLHSLFQSVGIPFESEEASFLNARIFSHIQEGMSAASKELAIERGEPEFMLGTGERFAHTTAVAPNATSAIICGESSPSVEPWNTNAYLHKTLSGSFIVKNKYLKRLLARIGQDTNEVWLSIVEQSGSVQHLDFLSEHDKRVYKTAFEMDQKWIIRLAAERQIFIAQAQSINLFFASGASAVDVQHAHFLAWQLGMKSLYYLRSATARRGSTVTKKSERNEIFISTPLEVEECLACEG